MIHLDPDQVSAARDGDRAALASVVQSLQGPVFRLALRMLAHPADAEDATQEILIKIITHLGTLRDDRAAGGWALKVASRHLVGLRKRSRVEAMRMSFRDFADDLNHGLADPAGDPADTALTAIAIEEIKVGCTLAMLTCLGRSLRIAYVLGDIFEMSDSEAAEALEISAAAYRQRLSRARQEVTRFVKTYCGVVSQSAACRCEKRLTAARARGRVTLGAPAFPLTAPACDIRDLRRQIRTLEEGRRAAALMRSNPDFPTHVGDLILEAMK
ncbi:RNA polymerase sigma factor [uncultured Sulfitobacter sp.]|uniref:RNA polymerase sigma factor n=1 Tax=uncultured Sulfitobacter sp. TaxID=191468 RepID=UPI002595BE70|nr:RNA polymerase sigma factor [uncultured Sulfitobacter sp.]